MPELFGGPDMAGRRLEAIETDGTIYEMTALRAVALSSFNCMDRV
jgi:hypothetical protein